MSPAFIPSRFLTRKICTLIFLCAAFLSAHAAAGMANIVERRVAFVVGNGAYVNVPELPNPRNDAAAVADALRASGFEVVTALDLNRDRFDAEFQRFIRSLAGADISLFYYSGHGFQIGGDNRIIPIDAMLKSPRDMEVETLSIRTIMSYMQANSKTQLIYLDSCRNNPFPTSTFLVGPDKELSLSNGGLAAQDASLGSLIAFSTQPGSVAVDGLGDKSPFTDSFLKNSFKLGVDVQAALMKVTQDVWASTNKKQRPWSSSTLVEPVYLAQPSILVAAAGTAGNSSSQPTIIAGSSATAAPDSGTAGKLPEDPISEPAPSPTEQLAGLIGDAVAEPRRVPIGVGAVALLDNLPIIRGNTPDRLELTAAPSQGVLYLDGKALLDGSIIDHGSLQRVTYEPAIGSEGNKESFEFQVAGGGAAGTPITGSIEPYLVQCDALAGEPLDLQGVAKGVLPNEIDADAAAAACAEAHSKFPEVARYGYELGRAKLAARDVGGARALFQEAANHGHIRASYQLGHMAAMGVGQPQDMDEANRLFRFGAENGDPYAMVSYGRNLVRGRNIEKNVAEGVSWLNKAVELGHTYAMNELGSMYYYGRGVKQNEKRGVRFYEAALARDDIYAMNNIALAYAYGKGVKRDPVTALALFKRASEGGHPSAPTNIGIMYFKGEGVKKDVAAAIHWYALGAERGDAWAASNLGWIYAKGPAAFRDAENAARYSSLARALDFYGENPKAGAELKDLPLNAKLKTYKKLAVELGGAGAAPASDIDAALIDVSRKLWQKHNPRYDLF